MRPKQRIRKIYTESDIPQHSSEMEENAHKPNNINIKDLQLNLTDPNQSINDQKSKNLMYKNALFYMPNKFNKINRKQLIKKLPDINLTSLNTISRPIKLSPLQVKQQDRMSASNKKNTFLLNSLFQILRPQNSNDRTQFSKQKEKTLKVGSNKNTSIDSLYQNEFINVSNSSTKNKGPRVLENQITRLSNHNNIMRRRIVSEEKSRPKFLDKSLDKLKQTTFDHFKRCVNRQDEAQLYPSIIQNSQPKESFENLQIITFYNKFPSFASKKKQEERTSIQVPSMQKRQPRQPKISLKQLRSKLRTQQPQYQQENEFIFEKH